MVANVFFFNRVKESGIYTVQSDVYSFGVFLIELVSGREARADESIIQSVRLSFCHTSLSVCNKRMNDSITILTNDIPITRYKGTLIQVRWQR